MNFQAGYILDGVSQIINKQFEYKSFFKHSLKDNEVNKLRGLFENISSFNLTFPTNKEIDYLCINPCLAVQNNILTRGLPTRAPIVVEEALEKAGLVLRNFDKEYEEKFSLGNIMIPYSEFFEVLHLVYPKLDIDRNNYAGQLDSDLEWKFLQNESPVFKQILQPQRFFSTLNPKGTNSKRLDFSYSIPYKVPFKTGVDYNGDIILSPSYKTVIFEVDGPHHLSTEYLIYDKIRDNLANEANAEVIRYPFSKIDQQTDISKDFDQTLIDILNKNYGRSIVENLPLYTIALLPFSVARIQKTLLEYFIRNPDVLNKEALNICFIERDIPGAALALQIFQDFVSNLNALLHDEDKLKLPQIHAVLLQDKNWLYDECLNCGLENIDWAQFSEDQYDLVIDSSMLLRDNIYNFNNTTSLNFLTVRSAHFVNQTIEGSRQIYCSEPLRYKPLVIRNEDTSYSPVAELIQPINYFLRNIFFKKSFREGQLPIISRALQKAPVIGLLPTGGGKSLTFQIPAFMQPGLTVIVDPIKSLMEDQVRVLKENWIDSVAYINSSQDDTTKNQSIADFKLGKKQMIFISPERFVIENFRDVLSNIHSTGFGQNIIYCVVDEVHCLSEWGHDFRTDYLMLGKNAQTYSYSRNSSDERDRTKIGLIGLTATASFDVLADIERELSIESDDVAQATIMIENTIRPELFFRVVDVSRFEDRSVALVEEMKSFKETFAYFNDPEVLLQSQKHHFDKFDKLDFCQRDEFNTPVTDNDGLIFQKKDSFLFQNNLSDQASITFCAVKGTDKNDNGEFRNKKGVRYVEQQLHMNGIPATFYHSPDNDQQQKIITENFNLFTGGKVNNMVCTKAFGMGIDKDNIRSTYHINYSGSLESLVQECGRAGRDKKTAVSTIFVDPRKKYAINPIMLYKYVPGLNSFQMKIVRESLDPEDKTLATKEDFLNYLAECEFKYMRKDGNEAALAPAYVKFLKEVIPRYANEILTVSSPDREIHDFFFNLAFKGAKIEKAQLSRLLNRTEFNLEADVQPPFREVFNSTQEGDFRFYLAFEHNLLAETEDKVVQHLPNDKKEKKDEIKWVFKDSNDVEDFWFNMNLRGILNEVDLSDTQIAEIEEPFLASRDKNETGKIVYRLNALGVLKSYTKDYNKKFYKCTFYKAASIDFYLNNLSKYLRRYQSEITVEKEIEKISEFLSFDPKNLVDDILVLLFHIADFSMTEIAHKRKIATDEIKKHLEEMLSMEGTDLEKNFYLKEQIYYYFNAKYAKPHFKEDGKEVSLLDDYRKYQDKILKPTEILYKFISDEILKFGTEQNNYKHLIGSCKKITYSLTTAELETDWILSLLNAFALYSTNNISYRNEANFVIRSGFDRLFSDNNFHQDDYGLVKKIFENYFKKLSANIRPDNPSIFDIDLIKNDLLQNLQAQQIEKLLNNYKTQLI